MYSVFKKWFWKNWTSICKKKKMNLDIDFTPFTKINEKSIIDLNVKCKTVKLLEDNTGRNLHDLGYGSYFLDIIPKA